MSKKKIINFTPCVDINEIVDIVVSELLFNIKNTNILTIGLAGNQALISILEKLAYNINKNKINVNHVTFFTLFEFVEGEKNIYFNLISDIFYKKINLSKKNIYFLSLENNEYLKKIKKQVLDIVIVEAGIDGHIALTSEKLFIQKRRKIIKNKLTESIREEYSNIFSHNKQQVPMFAYSAPIKLILNAKKTIIIASGVEKSSAVALLLANKYKKNYLITKLIKNKNVYLYASIDACSLATNG